MVSDIDLDGAVFVPISKQTLFQLVTVAEPQFGLFDPFSDVLLWTILVHHVFGPCTIMCTYCSIGSECRFVSPSSIG